MIPFHRLYSWLFKSFFIGEETRLVDRLIKQGYDKIMIIKRSWIFILYIFWIPLLLLMLSGASIWIAYIYIEVEMIKWTIIIGNFLMSTILLTSSLVYIRHFRRVHANTDEIIDDLESIKADLKQGDKYFITFFNWSITNQCLLVGIFFLELVLVFTHRARLDEHVLVVMADFIIILIEMYYLQYYRKRMMDLEMDFNVVVQGKIFFVNQTGVLSNTQTIESDKIKTIRSNFPNKFASFFNFGNIDILTEGDTGMLGALTMYYVTNPTKVVNSIQTLLGEERSMPPKKREALHQAHDTKINETIINITSTDPISGNGAKQDVTSLHAMDTRGKIRDILR